LKKTKIVVTVGPACEEPARLESLILAGADVMRINASHTTPEGIAAWVKKIRRAAAHTRCPIGIMVDLQGPRLRTGKLEGGKPIFLKSGEKICLEASSKIGTMGLITTPCREFPNMVKAGDRILLDNGLMELRVIETEKKRVLCRVVMGGLLKENKGINLPSAPITLPALTRKDVGDLQAAAKLDVDFIALSFVRTEKDMAVLKRWLKAHQKQIPVIAKIEKPRALEHIDAILEMADGIMVARGDLGIELGVAKVPAIQKRLIETANRAGVPVITATQMLESMIEKATPTRAEVSDIANAVFDGTDAVMLSGETAVGEYPLNTVHVMSDIVLEAEKSPVNPDADVTPMPHHSAQHEDLAIYSVTRAARNAQSDLKARAIVVFTLSGKTARLVSKFKPASPIIALCPDEKVSRRLSLLRGVIPLLIKYGKNTDQMLARSDQVILTAGLLKRGDTVVVVSGRQALPASRYMLTVHRMGQNI